MKFVATAPDQEDSIAFTVRFSPPPLSEPLPETQPPPGIGSAYMCSLRPGDRVAFRGPAGDFQLADSNREKILIGGGAGMAPLSSAICAPNALAACASLRWAAMAVSKASRSTSRSRSRAMSAWCIRQSVGPGYGRSRLTHPRQQ